MRLHVNPRLWCFLLMVAVSLVFASPQSAIAGASRYTVTDLGTLSGYSTSAEALNSIGHAVGVDNTVNGTEKAFFHNGIGLTQPCSLAHALGINVNDKIVGYTSVASGKSKVKHAVICTGSTLQDLTPRAKADAIAYDINYAGTVVGISDNQRAFRYIGGSMQDLGTLGGSGSTASAINSNGSIVGEATRADGKRHAFLYDGSMHDLGVLPGAAGTPADQSGAYAINISGHIVGQAYAACNAGGCSYGPHAIFIGPLGMKNLGVLPGMDMSEGFAVNAADDVVGWSFSVGGAAAGFIYTGGAMYRLSDLLNTAGWTISRAVDINDRGEILTTGRLNGGPSHAILLEPTLLDRYAPELRYDAQETYRADSAAEMTDNYTSTYTNQLLDGNNALIAASNPADASDDLSLAYLGLFYPSGRLSASTDHIDAYNNYAVDFQRMHLLAQYANNTYGRVVPYPNGDTVLEYWFFYYDNPKTFFFVGAHEGDWEMITIHLNQAGTPVEAAYAQHHGGELCSWSNVQTTADGRPIVYVAEGSHASYFTAGAHNLGYPDVYDYANGDGEIVRPTVLPTAPPPTWLGWAGQWGGSEASPYGPSQDPHVTQWQDPLAWEAAEGSSCTASGLAPVGPLRSLSNRPGLRPRNPVVTARRAGERVVINYRFGHWPAGAARPWQIVTSVVTDDSRYVPLTYRNTIRASVGRIQQPLGPRRRGLKLLVSVRTQNGGRSRTFAVPIQ
jgi:probable HAF family extracellular repeat protein